MNPRLISSKCFWPHHWLLNTQACILPPSGQNTTTTTLQANFYIFVELLKEKNLSLHIINIKCINPVNGFVPFFLAISLSQLRIGFFCESSWNANVQLMGVRHSHNKCLGRTSNICSFILLFPVIWFNILQNWASVEQAIASSLCFCSQNRPSWRVDSAARAVPLIAPVHSVSSILFCLFLCAWGGSCSVSTHSLFSSHSLANFTSSMLDCKPQLSHTHTHTGCDLNCFSSCLWTLSVLG